MKRFVKSFFSIVFVCGIIFNLLGTSASARSSEYLHGYSVMITPESNGKLVISLDITGVGDITEIGAKTIYVYESTNGEDFSWVKTYNSSDYPKMMGSGKLFYKDVLTHQGTAGRYYYAKACVYAGNSTGGDERYCNSAIKQAKA